jgi:SAM-dependent methyltransferase
MNENSYNTYISEVSGWLHKGRTALIERILGFFAKPYSPNQEILEIGAGAGQNIPTLCKFGTVDALEQDAKGLEALNARTELRQVFSAGIPCQLPHSYDIICAFDVIEHIKDDRAVMQWIADNLKPGGLFIATVPAHQWFFTQHDVALGHHRRYTKKSFRAIIPSDFNLLSESHYNTWLFPFAVLARLLWVVKVRLSKNVDLNKQPHPRNGLLSRMLLAIFLKEVEQTTVKTSRSFGLSYYVCLRKQTLTADR